MSMTVTVTCPTNGCENEGVEITVDPWDGSTVICGPCGAVLEPQAGWHQTPSMEDAGLISKPEEAVNLIAQMTEQERTELIRLINLVVS